MRPEQAWMEGSAACVQKKNQTKKRVLRKQRTSSHTSTDMRDSQRNRSPMHGPGKILRHACIITSALPHNAETWQPHMHGLFLWRCAKFYCPHKTAPDTQPVESVCTVLSGHVSRHDGYKCSDLQKKAQRDAHPRLRPRCQKNSHAP
jgi:hypothetical protein